MTDSVSNKKRKCLRHFAAFLSWRRLHITDSGFTLVLSFLIGVLAGICAFVLKLMIDCISGQITRTLNSESFNWILIILPVFGIISSALFCRYILKDNVANGVSLLMNDLATKRYQLKGNTIYGSIIASTLTLGFGGSAGAEGPIAYAGAGIGSKLGQFLKVSPQMMMILIGCGAAAGIAGIFKSPIGGALFTIEVLRIQLTTLTVLGVFMSTITAALVAYALSGCTLDISVISPGIFDYNDFIWLIPLGVVCGLYSLYYTWTGAITKKRLSSLHSDWIKYILSGLTLGAMICIFPSLFGEGYNAITSVIGGDSSEMTKYSIFANTDISPSLLVMILCGGMLLFKGIGSSATNNGGGVAGDFAPTLFAGCMLGLFFATVTDYLGFTELNTSHFALIAMAGAMAGIIRAPLMAMFIVTEMIGGFVFLLPVATVSLISYCIVMIFKHDTFYHSRPFSSSLYASPKNESSDI